MALRHIVTKEDNILHKICREQVKFDERLHQLIDEMAETLEKANGVGLAAPQVGILRRVVLVLETNVPDDEDEQILELINPEIIESSGSQTGQEGCLSLPGKAGIVTRPDHVKVKALDENMEEFVLEGTGLLARAICHECDHLDGLMYVSKVEGELMDVEPVGEEEEDME